MATPFTHTALFRSWRVIAYRKENFVWPCGRRGGARDDGEQPALDQNAAAVTDGRGGSRAPPHPTVTPATFHPSSARSSVTVSTTFALLAKFVRNLTTRSEEHTSELQSLMRISYAFFCLKKKHIILYLLS